MQTVKSREGEHGMLEESGREAENSGEQRKGQSSPVQHCVALAPPSKGPSTKVLEALRVGWWC